MNSTSNRLPELKKDLEARIKIRIKLLSPNIFSIIYYEQNKNTIVSNKRVFTYVNSIVILNKENEAEEEGSVEPSKTKYTNCENANKTNEEVESEKEVEEEIKGEIEEEEEDDLEHFDTFLIMKELRYHERLWKNPWPPWVKAKISTYYRCLNLKGCASY
ncbi:hypothetical protein Tco_0365532 [Tanacetum coccineum]